MTLHNALNLKVPKIWWPKLLKIAGSSNHSTVVLRPSPLNADEYPHDLIPPESRVPAWATFCCWQCEYLFSDFRDELRKTHLLCSRVPYGRSNFGSNRKGLWDFLLVINSNLGLSRTVSEIRRLIGWKSQIFLPLSCFPPSVGVTPLELLEKLYWCWKY